MKRAIFLDRDGVLNEENGFVFKKEDFFILPGVVEALKILKEKGYFLIAITNQPAIARGLISEEGVENFHKFMNQQLNNLIDKFCFCPHHPEMHPNVPDYAKKYRIKCGCRKPAPGMLLQAAKELDIDLEQSWVIGDMITDIVAGKLAGCKTIKVESPKNGTIIVSHIDFDKNIKPDKYVKDLLEATQFL